VGGADTERAYKGHVRKGVEPNVNSKRGYTSMSKVTRKGKKKLGWRKIARDVNVSQAPGAGGKK